MGSQAWNPNLGYGPNNFGMFNVHAIEDYVAKLSSPGQQYIAVELTKSLA